MVGKNNWSYRKLVREFGEDRALELLQTMKGNGEFVHSHNTDIDTPYNYIHDYSPYFKKRSTPITELRIDVGWTPQHKKGTSSTSK